MSKSKLINIVANIDTYDSELTIYAVKPWTCDSVAFVAREPDEGGVPIEAKTGGAEYFIEVFLANEFLVDWVAAQDSATSEHERCERLIHYVVYDA